MAWEEFRGSVPSAFRCPISLDLMLDPVSLCTGMTYDRCSIKRWLDAGHKTCPSTMQTLADQTLTPNHTLRKLIQSWRLSRAAVDRPPATRQPPSPSPLQEEQTEVMKKYQADHPGGGRDGSIDLAELRKMKTKAKESSKYCRSIADSGAVPMLLSILGSCHLDRTKQTNTDDQCEAVVAILALIPADPATKRSIASPQYLLPLTSILSLASIDARINAAVLLESLAMDRNLKLAVGQTEGLIKALVQLLGERSNPMAAMASLRTLLSLCVAGRNRLRAVRASAIAALIELLPHVASFTSEHTLAMLEMLCKCAEGRAAFIAHPFSISIVSHKIRHLSDTPSEYAVAILWEICRNCGEDIVLIRLEEAGMVEKMMLLCQVELSSSPKHKMAEFLKLLKSISRRGNSPDQTRRTSMDRSSSEFKNAAKTHTCDEKQSKYTI